MKNITDYDIVDALAQNDGNISATSRQIGLSRRSIGRRLKRLSRSDKPVFSGSIKEFKRISKPLPSKGIKRYLISSAQNNTKLHPQWWKTLNTMASYYDAEIMIARFTYNKHGFTQHPEKAGDTFYEEDELWYPSEIESFVSDDRVVLAPGLVFCGEMNILPTAVRPLSGLESYSGKSSAIFPHVKVAAQSIPVLHGMQPKFNYTTGTISTRNYIRKKAGLKADFHHTYGALMVEIQPDGEWWVRQIIAAEDGSAYDLCNFFDGDTIVENTPIEAVNWGDIHEAKLEN